MLRCRAALALHRLSSDGAKGLKFGGFEDPWWAGSRFNKPNPFEIPGKEKDKFPFINDKTGPHRPLKNEPWQPKYTLNGRKLRGYFQYDHHFHGNAPKPHWAMNQVTPTGTRKYHGGASAKPVWCPPKKRQREAMINTDEIVEEDLPPAEFMESYSRLRKRYQEELAAVRDVCFHEYVEPILVEEEAIAQIQLWLRKNNWIHKKPDAVRIFKNVDLEVRDFPARHRRFLNWYAYMPSGVEKFGRGKLLVKEQIDFIQESMQTFSEIEGNAGNPVDIRDLSRRIQWNEFRNEKMKPLFDKKLQKNQIKLLEEQEEKIRSVLKVQKRREEQQAKHFKKFTEEAKEFIYPTNVEDKILAALENPVTSNIPIDQSGTPRRHEAKVLTTEKNFRLTPTEQEYFDIRKMKEEQRLRGNVDLEDHLKKVDEEFFPENDSEDIVDIEDIIESEKSDPDTLDSLEKN